MKHLMLAILMALIFGCGADPDDFSPQEPDGCRSGDTECQEKANDKNPVILGTDTSTDTGTETEADVGTMEPSNDEITVNVDVNTAVTVNINSGETSAAIKCAPNKICRGMTKAEVHAVIGDPNTVNDWFNEIRWEFREPGKSGYYCVSGPFDFIDDKCNLSFKEFIKGGNKVELLIGSDNMNSAWLDVLNY